ncbi:MAG: rane dipeptidase [Thermoanaerobacter sp.]|jgi:membrane dipeptidase|uniref:dipeptidase n=1 Tax=Desulfofundulus thermocisternus TaxID=42471 RepID=UPI0004845161|nr:dipeptidase [Desulfofundulus thermocisternus]MDK2887220.1 rane dipeptidase [Thermoanaerobacter sp.]
MDWLSLHHQSVVVDAHCDVLTAMEVQNRRLNEAGKGGHVDLERLRRGGIDLLFMAAFIAPAYRERAVARAMILIDRFYSELEANGEELMMVTCYEDIAAARAAGKVGVLLTIEGGEALGGSLEVLRILYRLGVRSITLTWNGRNELADGVAEEGTRGGLTRFGREVVREMNRLGMLVDVSHLSEAGFWDVLEVSSRPVVATHANSRYICDHRRNLSDEQIRALAAQGGVIGLCFYPPFVHPTQPSLSKLLDHLDHMVQVGGIGCVGIGSDFDGIEEAIPELKDVSCLPLLTEALYQRGYRAEEISAILGGNFLRVLHQVLPGRQEQSPAMSNEVK